jgi:hypothetical protein
MIGESDFRHPGIVSVLSMYQVPEKNNMKKEKFILAGSFSAWLAVPLL